MRLTSRPLWIVAFGTAGTAIGLYEVAALLSGAVTSPFILLASLLSLSAAALVVETIVSARRAARCESEFRDFRRLARISCWQWSADTDRLETCEDFYPMHGLTPPAPGEPDSAAAAWRWRLDWIKREVQKRGSGSCLHRVVEPDGRVRWIEVWFAGECDASGQPRRIRGTAQDVTGRKLVEQASRENETNYRLLLESMSDVIFSVGIDGRIQSVSPTVKQILGCDPEDLVDRPVLEALRLLPQHHSLANQQLARVLMGEQIRGTFFEFTTVADEVRCAEVSGSPLVVDGRVVAAVCVARDVTERRRADELHRRQENAEAASKAKTLFLARMSHEIRTPLNGVVGMLELLAHSPLDARQSHYIGIARSSVDALLAVINDILDFSKIEAGKIEIHRTQFDLHGLIEETADLFEHRARQKGLKFSASIRQGVPHWVVGDPDRIRQIVINLLGNALKFTPHGEIGVSVELLPDVSPECMVRIAVHDTGIGIAGAKQHALFQAFSQVDASITRKYGGTGLGLSICRQLAELLGGSIGVESVEGRGSKFLLDLPLPRLTHAPDVDGTPWLEGIRVLAVDDNERNREILHGLLARWGATVQMAAAAEEALAALRQTDLPFHLAILDRNLPDMDGLELARAIKQDAAIAGIPLLILTSIDDAMGSARAPELGLAGYLSKPIRPSRLLPAVLDALGARLSAGPAATDAVPKPASSYLPNVPAATVVANSASVPNSLRLDARVLVAEDNPVNQVVIVEMLQSFGCQCDTVTNGREAVQAVMATPYDIVMMDCEMPELDGFCATREIRTLESLGQRAGGGDRPLRIVALTAHAVEGDRDRCLAAGMSDYLSKPIEPEYLLAVLRRVLGEARKKAAEPGDGTRLPKATDAAEAATLSDRSPVALDFDAPPPPLDLTSLRNRCMGKTNVMRRVLQVFSDRARQDLDTICTSLELTNAEHARRLAHALKGGAANISAMTISRIAGELETSLEGGRVGPVAASLTQLEEEMSRCLDYIDQLLYGPLAEKLTV